MSISYVGTGALMAATSSPQTVVLPSGITTNDLALLCMVADATGGASITSTGYTEAASFNSTGHTPDSVLTLLRKFAGASEANPSAATSAGASNGFFGAAGAFRGVDTTTPLDGVTPVGSQSSGAVSTFAPTGVTSITDAAWAVSVAVCESANPLQLVSGSEQGFTVQFGGTNYSTLTGSDVALALATKEIATAGAVTFPTWKPTTGTARIGAISLVLRPSASAPPAADSAAIKGRRVTGSGESFVGMSMKVWSQRTSQWVDA